MDIRHVQVPMVSIVLTIFGLALATPPNVRVNSVTTNLQNEEQIWISPNNANVVLADWRDWRLGYRRVGIGVSTNGGATWSDSLISVTFFNRQSDPCLVADRLGKFYMNVLDYDAASSNTNSLISVWRSTNNGVSWSGPVAVEQVGDYFEDKQFTTVDRTGGAHDGNYYVSWTRFPNPTRILFVRSTDGGVSFGDTVLIRPAVYEPDCGYDVSAGQFSIPIVDADGDVHVFWAGYQIYPDCFFDYAIRHAVSTNGGASFSPDVVAFLSNAGYESVDGGVDVYGMPNGDCDISGGLYDNTIYISQTQFVAGSFEETDVVVRRSTDKGVTWSAKAIVNDDKPGMNIDQFHPWLVVNEDGVVLLIFYDQRNDPVNHFKFDAYFSASFDGGETYIHNQRVSDVSIDPNFAFVERSSNLPAVHEADGRMLYYKQPPRSPMAGKFAEYIGIHARRDTISTIWTDTRGGNQDAYSARFIMPFVQPRLYSPADRDTNFHLTPALRWSTCWHENDDSYRLEISKDSIFTTVERIYASLPDNNFTVPTPLDSGVYFWRVKAFRSSGSDSTIYSETFRFGRPAAPSYICGDANHDGTVDISDAVYLIQYIFAGGPAPNPLLAGDANCDLAVDISDAVYLIAYIFAGGPAPCAGCK